MTIQEAMKSGQSFKRRVHYSWYSLKGATIWMDGLCIEFSYLDIVADDWEIRAVERTINLEKLKTVLSYGIVAKDAGLSTHIMQGFLTPNSIREICRMLGFEEA